MSKNKNTEEKMSDNFKPAPEVKKSTQGEMRVETFLHIVGAKEINKLGLVTYAKKFSKKDKQSFDEWKEFFKKY